MIDSAKMVALLVGLWLTAIPLAEAQTPTQSPLNDTRVAQVRDSLAQAQAEAEAQGLPAEWLRDKVAEGLAKHAPPERIAQAVETLLGRMQGARGIQRRLRMQGADTDHRVLRALVDALSAGSSATDLSTLVMHVSRQTHSRDAVLRAAITLADLEERGLEPAFALRVATDAFRNGGVAGLNALRATARRTRPHDLRDALERAALGSDRGVTVRETMAHGGPGGPPHDNAFGHGRARGR